jgi:transposase
MPKFAGLDWGGAHHAICIIDETGRTIAQFDIAHSAEGLAEMKAKLDRLGPPGELTIAIERPSGLIVDALVKAGYIVVPIHPNVVKACRPRYRAAGGKSDPGDAYMLADILRTDGHRFRPLKQQSDEIMALRALVRGRDDLVTQRVACTNQLRSLLEGFWPGAASIFAELDSPIALAFLAEYPTPDSAKRLGEKRMGRFIKRQSYSGRRSAGELLERLRAAPAGLTGPAQAEASGAMVVALVGVVSALVTQIASMTKLIEATMADLPDGKIMMSFPRSGKVSAAQIIAEIGDVRDRFPTEEQLAAEAGVAPVTHASGKSRGVVFRRACNKHLRKAITCFADNSRHASDWAATIYKKARDRGCHHQHAIRILARAWIRIIWRAWRDSQVYNPAKHGAAPKIAA